MTREPAHAMAYLDNAAMNYARRVLLLGEQFRMYGGRVEPYTYVIKTDIDAEIRFGIIRPKGLENEFAEFLKAMEADPVSFTQGSLKIESQNEDGRPKERVNVVIRCAYSFHPEFWKHVRLNQSMLHRLLALKLDDPSYMPCKTIRNVAIWMAYYQFNGKFKIDKVSTKTIQQHGLDKRTDCRDYITINLPEPEVLSRLEPNDLSKLRRFLEELGAMKQKHFPAGKVDWGLGHKDDSPTLSSNIEYRLGDDGEFIGFKYINDYHPIMTSTLASKRGFVTITRVTHD